MDRYVIREARFGANYPQGNQMMAFSTNTGRNNVVPSETVYYGGSYANQFVNMQHASTSNYVDVGNMNAPVTGQNTPSAQGQMMTGIDPRYLANYSDNSAQYILAGQPMQNEPVHVSNDFNFGSNYQNRNFTGTEKNKHKMFTQGFNAAPRSVTPQNVIYDSSVSQTHSVMRRGNMQQIATKVPHPASLQNVIYDSGANKVSQTHQVMQQIAPKETPKVAETAVLKKQYQNQTKSRAERLQALHKSGPRAFSGPVEKVLKWHKALQDIGVFIFYEIVGKCVSVRSGESCSKNLVIRDENGPAMQVVYYEIDFLLSELKVPSTVRVIGRMMAGTCRLQAFSIRPATGDDVAILPRRAAVAAHHVAKLCKEYGINV